MWSATRTAHWTCLSNRSYSLTARQAMTEAGLAPEQAEVTMHPATTSSLEADDAGKMVRLLDMLEDLDDVQQVYSNADISDDLMAQL